MTGEHTGQSKVCRLRNSLGGVSGEQRESAVEISDVIESDIHSDVGYFIVRFQKLELGFADAERIDVLHRRITVSLLEQVGNVIGTQTQSIPDYLQSNPLGVMLR